MGALKQDHVPASESLAGLGVVVTGANRGLGAAFVSAALRRGAEVVYAAARNPVLMADHPAVLDGRVKPVAFDLTDPDAAARMAEDCPRASLVVCNAGAVLFGQPLSTDLDDVRAHFEVNFFGQLALMSAFAPVIRGRRNGFIVVTSAAAQILSRSASAYGASKAALAMLGYAVGTELADRGATVSVVYPGYVATDMVEDREMPKASPAVVADRVYDGWIAGKASIFPDRHAEIVEETLISSMSAVLDDPRSVADAVAARFAADPEAGR